MKKQFCWIAVLSFLAGACGFSRPSTFYVLDSNDLPMENMTLAGANKMLMTIRMK